jgi:tRNA threonylcarbamoyl adenosine modification protein (Sua5/YciO/YrdC/YwlC family)
MIINIHPDNPQKRTLDQIAEGLRKGGVYIIATDTVYALVCSSEEPRAISEIYRIKRMDEDHPLSLICSDVAMASKYTQGIPDTVFRFMKSATPGPYTFIFKANRQMDKRGTGKKKEVGIRIVNSPLIRELLERMDSPLAATSVTSGDEYYTDPEDLDAVYGKMVQAVIDGGIRPHEYSTILDCTDESVRLVRQGAGSTEKIDDILIRE